jgi:NAD(P)-dependent dehydrogenase (short-subunit alcohol dehydrogenase family)
MDERNMAGLKIDLGGNVALVTGAASGLGVTLAQHLARAGATVAVHCNRHAREADALCRDLGNGARSFGADLSDPEQADALFEQVVDAFGRVHTLVNNAGVYVCAPMRKPTAEWLDDWHHTLAVNLTAPGLLCRAAIRHFREHGGGRIVNIASRAAFRGDTKDHLAYAASKGGLVSLTRSIARAFGKEDIKAFVVAPGFIRTPMADEYFKEHGEEGVLSELSLSKMTEPDDIAPAVTFLASGMMDHATGQAIDINAGSYVR